MTTARKTTAKPIKPFVDHIVEDIRRFREAKAAEYGYNPHGCLSSDGKAAR
jgi:hypothetical protein